MTIAVGDRLPAATFKTMSAEGPKDVTTDEIFAGKKVVFFAVPGAFTPTCSKTHLPGYVAEHDAILAKGVDTIAVTAVNDVFVMTAWAEASGAAGKILFLADGSAAFATAIGLTLDATAAGLGIRSQRWSMLVDDGVVRELNIEPRPGVAELSGAACMLGQL
ncbi:peroxiredoxin [Siculibacillus lacustris]|uniref:Glutathione-dependent peroxiredoxin n=1 Tax=Siculibacillus lacustris TaxID=1549641 RepID=A0A4Q9VJF2_9HYPH|nr:peroxiredoxin [Siculibacillus lacustris]TBW34963.1 peroxiredoxin [Siculibacillus lacustris]